MAKAVAYAGELFDYAAEKPNGFEKLRACQTLGITPDQFNRAVRSLRSILATDEINLVCISQGFGQPMRYELVGNLERAQPWIKVRYAALESQLETVLNVSASLVNATDGRTIPGRKARLIHRHVGRLIEDIADLEGRLPMMAGVGSA